MKYHPLVTFIIINWNGGEFVQQCIYSILNQTYDNIEVLVVDNCSTDNSVAFIESFVNKFPIVRLIKNNKNFGFSRACNIGANHANGEFIVFVNNDAILNHDWLINIINKITYNPNVAVASGPIFYYSNPRLIWSLGARFDKVSGFSWNLGQKKYHFQNGEFDYLSGCVMLVNKNVFKKIGMFDESFFIYDDDIDLCFRAKYLGYKLEFVDESISFHKVSESKKKLPYKIYYYKARSDIMFCFKHLNIQYIFTSIFFHILQYFAEAFLFKMNPLYFFLGIKAFLWNLINLNTIFKKRVTGNNIHWKPKNRFKEFISIAKDRVMRREIFW